VIIDLDRGRLHASLTRHRHRTRQLSVQRDSTIEARKADRQMDIDGLDDSGFTQARQLGSRESPFDHAPSVRLYGGINDCVGLDIRGPRHGARILAITPPAVKKRKA